MVRGTGPVERRLKPPTISGWRVRLDQERNGSREEVAFQVSPCTRPGGETEDEGERSRWKAIYRAGLVHLSRQ